MKNSFTTIELELMQYYFLQSKSAKIENEIREIQLEIPLKTIHTSHKKSKDSCKKKSYLEEILNILPHFEKCIIEFRLKDKYSWTKITEIIGCDSGQAKMFYERGLKFISKKINM